MIKQMWNLSSDEKYRILRLHEQATQRLYLISEQEDIESFSVDFGNTFESGKFDFNTDYMRVVNDNVKKIADYILNKKLKDFKIVISPGESQVPNQPPFEKVGSLAEERGKYLKNYLEETLSNIIGFIPEIVINPPTIGTTPWDINKGKDAPEYKKEQFVKATIDLTTSKTKPPQPNKNFVINVRGDEPNGRGAYYFPKTLEDWKKITYDPRLKGFFSAAEQKSPTSAQTSVNMNDDVFRQYWSSKAPDLESILGPAYLRDTQNQNNFILK